MVFAIIASLGRWGNQSSYGIIGNQSWANISVDTADSDEHIALIQISGIIASDTPAAADVINESLRNAFDHEGTRVVVLEIDSPGGSPVQAGAIYDEIKRLKVDHPTIPIYALIQDICASGGYYIAAATDEIYANRASLTGSIGVISAGFGFKDLIAKIGVERRLYTAGNNKGFLDPFLEENPAEKAAWLLVLKNIHDQFIDYVKKGRGHLLKDDPAIFSGLVWTGEQAKEIGLVDHIGDMTSIQSRFELDIIDFTQMRPPFEIFLDSLGSSIAWGLLNTYSAQKMPQLLR